MFRSTGQFDDADDEHAAAAEANQRVQEERRVAGIPHHTAASQLSAASRAALGFPSTQASLPHAAPTGQADATAAASYLILNGADPASQYYQRQPPPQAAPAYPRYLPNQGAYTALQNAGDPLFGARARYVAYPPAPGNPDLAYTSPYTVAQSSGATFAAAHSRELEAAIYQTRARQLQEEAAAAAAAEAEKLVAEYGGGIVPNVPEAAAAAANFLGECTV